MTEEISGQGRTGIRRRDLRQGRTHDDELEACSVFWAPGVQACPHFRGAVLAGLRLLRRIARAHRGTLSDVGLGSIAARERQHDTSEAGASPPRSDACRLGTLPTKATPPAAANGGRSQGCAEDFSAWPHSELEGSACHVTQPRGCERRALQRGDRRVREERSLGGGAVAAPRNGVDAQRESRRVLVLVRDLGTSQGAQRLASSPRAAARDAHAGARTLALLLQRGDHGVR